MARVKNAGGADFPRLFAELRRIFPEDDDEEHEADPRHEEAVRFLIGHWLAMDAEAAVAFACAPDSNGSLCSVTGELLGRAWPEKAVAMISAKGTQNLPREFVLDAMIEVMTLHPAIYLRFDPQGAWEEELTGLWSGAVKALAAKDPAAAAQAWLLYRPSDNHLPDYASLPAIVSAWQAKDCAAARAWAESLTDEDSRLVALHEWMDGLARKSPTEAMKELGSIQLGPAKKYFGGDYGNPAGEAADARLNFAREWAKHDLAGALAVSQKLAAAFGDTTDEDREYSLKLVRQWMVRSRLADLPDEPAAFMSGLAAMEATAKTLDTDTAWWEDVVKHHLLDRLAAWGTDQCLTAVQTSPAADSDILQALLQRAADANPVQALERLSQLPAETVPTMTKLLFKQQDALDMATRQELLASLPADQWDESVMDWLHGSEADFAATLAAHPVVEDGKLVTAFAKDWADDDPAAAAQWVSELPDSNGWTAAGEVAAVWAGLDEAGASAWVDSLPPGEVRDRAAAGLVKTLAPADPESAWAWALNIQSPWDQTEALTEVAKALGTSEPEALTKDRHDAAGAIIRPLRELTPAPPKKP